MYNNILSIGRASVFVMPCFDSIEKSKPKIIVFEESKSKPFFNSFV
jgi:hypothetical protein